MIYFLNANWLDKQEKSEVISMDVRLVFFSTKIKIQFASEDCGNNMLLSLADIQDLEGEWKHNR